MKEKQTFKRALAFFLSVVLTFTTFASDLTLVTANAAVIGTTTQMSDKVVADDGNVYVEKKAKFNDDGTVDVTFSVQNKQTSSTTQQTNATDVVFVLDTSGSMESTFSSVKTSAGNFAEALVSSKENADKNIRIGVVAFAKEGWTKVSLTNPWKNGSTVVSESAFNTNVNNIKSSINAIPLQDNNNYGGTNIQAGIHTAASMLASSPAKTNKIIILLSDGVPTYSYKASGVDANGNLTFSSSSYGSSNIVGCGYHYDIHEEYYRACYDASYSYNIPGKKAGWYYEDGTYATDKSINSWSIEKKSNDAVEGRTGTYNGKKVIYTYAKVTVSNNGQPAIAEANIVRNKGITVYTIGYNLSSLSNTEKAQAESVLSSVANSGLYSAASSADINNVLKSICSNVETQIAAANGTSIKDIFPDYLTVVSAEGCTVTSDPATGKDTVNWSLGKDATSGSFTIKVKISDYEKMYSENGGSAEDFKNGAYVKLNESCEISYLDKNNAPRKLDTIKGDVVPYGPLRTYPYEINFTSEDGSVKYGTTVTGYAAYGEKVNFNHMSEYFDVVDNDGEKVYVYKGNSNDHSVTVNGSATTGFDFVMPNLASDSNKKLTINVSYAKKTYPISYTIADSDHISGGVAYGDVKYVEYGSKVTYVPENPASFEADGYRYEFKSWSVIPEETVVKGATTIEATYKDKIPVNYNVKFFVLKEDGSDYFSKQTKTVKNGSTVSAEGVEVANATYTGANTLQYASKTFNGKWYTDASCTNEYDFTTPVTSEVSLYAGYTDVEKTYTIIYKNIKGDAEYKYGTELAYSATIPNLEYSTALGSQFTDYIDEAANEKHTFGGWDKAGKSVSEFADESGKIYVNPVRNTSQYTYAVTWYNGDEELKTVHIVSGNTTSFAVQGLATPAKASTNTTVYTFAGFTLDGDANAKVYGADEAVTVTRALVFRATFEESTKYYTYTFKYKNSDFEDVTEEHSDVTYNSTLAAPSIEQVITVKNADEDEKTEYTFKAWSDYSFENGITNNAVSVAEYSSKDYYLVTFNYDGKTETQWVESGKKAVAPSYTKEKDAEYTYAPVAWDMDPNETAITEPTTFNGTCAGTPNEYYLTVSIVKGNDTTVKTVKGNLVDATNVSYTFDVSEFNVNGKRYQISETPVLRGATQNGNTFSAVLSRENTAPSVKIVLAEEPKFFVTFKTAGMTLSGLEYVPIYSDLKGTTIATSTSVYAGQSITVPEAAVNYKDEISTPKYTYTFNGTWVDENGKAVDLTAPITKDVTVYAAYSRSINSYTVTFMDKAQDAEKLDVVSTISVDYGETVSSIPAIDSYNDTQAIDYIGGDFWQITFVGAQDGSLNAGDAFTASSVVNGDVTVVASRPSKAQEYKVTYVIDEKTFLEGESISYGAAIFNEAVAENAPSKEADKHYTYVFKQWNYEDGTAVNWGADKIYDDITVYGEFTSVPYEYRVTFLDAEGAEIGESVKAVWNENENAYVLPDFSAKESYVKGQANDATANSWEYEFEFVKWVLVGTNTDAKDALKGEISDSFTVKAVVKSEKKYYTLKYVGPDNWSTFESLEAGTEKTVINGITKEATVDTVFTFDSWKESDVTSYKPGDVIKMMADHVLTAIFKESVREYDVTYLNEGVSFDTEKAAYGTAVADVKRPAGKPVKESEKANGYVTSYDFASWDFGDVETISCDTVANAVYSRILTPVDPEAVADEHITIVGKKETGNVFTNDSALVEGASRKVIVTGTRDILEGNTKVGTITISENGDYELLFVQPCTTTINVAYLFSANTYYYYGNSTEAQVGSYANGSLSTSINVKVGEAKTISLEDVEVTYDTEDHTVKYTADDSITVTGWSIDGKADGEQPARSAAGTYKVKATGTFEFEGQTFNTESEATLTINKKVVKVSLPKDMTVFATEFAVLPDFAALATVGDVYSDVTLAPTYEVQGTYKNAVTGRFIVNEDGYTVKVNAEIVGEGSKNYTLIKEDGILKIFNSNTGSAANFYLVLPGKLSKLNKEYAGLSEKVKGQDTNNYTGVLFGREFVYDFSPYVSNAETFGAELDTKVAQENTVEAYFPADSEKGLAAVKDYTYTYQAKDSDGKVINTYEMSDIDWYAIKDYSKKDSKTGKEKIDWHVDGYARSIVLVKEALAGKTLTYTYNGKTFEDTIKKDIAAYLKAESDKEAGGTYTVVADTYSANVSTIKNVNATAEDVTVTVKYSDGIDETVDPTFTVTFPVKVNKATLTVPAKNYVKTYDGEGYLDVIEVTGQNKEVLSFNVNCDETEAGTYNFYSVGNANNKVSVVPAQASVEALANYDVTYSQVSVTINKAALTKVTVNDQTKVYGEEDPALTVTVEGLIATEAQNAEILAALNSFAYRTDDSENVADKHELAFNVDAANASAVLKNYSIGAKAVKNGKLTITKAPLFVTVANGSKVYDGTAKFEDIEVLSFGSDANVIDGLRLNDTFEDIAACIVMYRDGDGKDADTYAGELKVNEEATNKKLANYEVSGFATGDFTITKATLDVYPVNATKVYGAADPEFDYTLVGLVGSDTKASLKDDVHVVRNGNDENVGTYVGVLSVKEDSTKNYTIVGHYGNFEITPSKALSVEGGKDQTYTYDGTNHGEGVTPVGMVYADDVITVTYTYEADGETVSSETVPTFKNFGEYTVKFALTNPNYVTYEGQYTITVGQRDLDVSMNDQEYIYNGANQGVGITATTDVEGDELSIVYTVDGEEFDEAPVFKNAGTYEVTADVKDASAADNYKHYTVKYTVVVAPKKAVITVADAGKVYGNLDPAFEATVSGNMEGEEISYTLTREEGINVGTYAITAVLPDEDAVNANYDIEVVDGTFTITRRTVIITANDASKLQGAGDPIFTGGISNLAYNDSIAVDYWRDGGEAPGTYSIYAVVHGNYPNYEIDTVDGTFTIIATQAPAVIPTPGPIVTPVTPTPGNTPEPTGEGEAVEGPSEVAETIEIGAGETPLANGTGSGESLDIEDEETPLAAAHCWIHWLVLVLSLVYALYATLRAVQNKRELDDQNEEVAEN